MSDSIVTLKNINPQDILFVNLPSVSPDLSNTDAFTSAINPPLGLLYLANSIQNCTFVNSYKCVDFAAYNYERFSKIEELKEFISKKLKHGGIEKPSVVAVSLMFSSSYDFFKIVIAEIKKCWQDTIVMVGGIHASNTVEYLLKNDCGIDYITCGEGEEAFVEFLEMIATGTQKNILGVHSLSNIKKVGINQFEQTNYIQDINIDYTRYSNLIDMEKYTAETSLFSLSKTTLSVRSFAIMASRGCPYHCTFCASHTVHGRVPRWRDIQNVVDEIRWLNKTYGVTKYYLIDDNFIPKSKAIELFTVLSKIDIEGFEIVILNMSINSTNFGIIDAIVAANITNIAFAIESGSTRTQKKIKKNVRLDKAIDLVKYSQSKGLNVRCFYIIGFPGETIEEMGETFEYAKRLGADWSTFSVASPIPGTEMYDEFVTLGYIEDGPNSWTAPTLRDRVFDTKEINRKEIEELAYKANLDVNFINNANIKKGDYETAKIIFSNFIKMYDYHIFAYDCLRRIYKETGNRQKENEIFEQMIAVLASNKKAQSYRKYFNFLDNDIRKVLEKT
ncbi:MAG: hypothetical protein DRR16_21975 [Candidatus Parabeggiatoa sp. nov. 3]|nr:MAG: hypothetical protein DRR00_26120 [Gammaproteobacteria bacterium]RKZ59982.1 MAG: hypothetical protein DRQ99_22840 [Gammaproteobacteria bacterium]RKZ81527.1 MAG: hypothetical protein DRR16_21975 [Gammaproteobacteria bacterium]